MKILPKLDSGPILLKEKLKITKDDDYISLSKKLSILGSKTHDRLLKFNRDKFIKIYRSR